MLLQKTTTQDEIGQEVAGYTHFSTVWAAVEPLSLREYLAAGSSLADYLEEIEETVIRQHLMTNEGNVSKTASDLGMLRQNLQHKIKKYGV